MQKLPDLEHFFPLYATERAARLAEQPPQILLAPGDLQALCSALTGYLPYLRSEPPHDAGRTRGWDSCQRRLSGLLAEPDVLERTPIFLSQIEVAVMREALFGFCTLLPLLARDRPAESAELVAGLMKLHERLSEMQGWWLH